MTDFLANLSAVRQLIDDNGGKRTYLINWEWAHFDDEVVAQKVFDQIKEVCEHRGFHKAQPESDNPNLRKAAFRFR